MPNPRPSNQARITAAVWFAERGFGVFPCWSTHASGACRCPQGQACTSPGKHPLTVDGFKSATLDATRIRTFLAAASAPNYGLVAPEGVFVLDVDGEGWQARMAELEERHGRLPATFRDATANGQHIFLRWPDAYPRPLKQLFGWVTRWGSGPHSGYVIGPRSVHASGAEYRPVEGTVPDIAMLPDAWAAAGVTPERTVTVRSGPHFDTVTAGGRHDFLRDRARTLRGGGLTGEALFTAVMQVNEEYCVPPKSADEVRRAIGDVETKFAADPIEASGEYGERSGDQESPVLAPAKVGEFPDPPHPAAYGGLCGEIIESIAVNTDASEVGLLASFLALSGAVFPARAYMFGDQTTSPYILLVGETSLARKGTAMRRALDCLTLTLASNQPISNLLLDGINSGEGLIRALSDRKAHAAYTAAVVFEEEFSSLLASRGRDGSTLDPKLRVAFDGGSLSNRKVSGELTVQPPYWLPALAGITPRELRRRLEEDAAHTGSANRWLYIPVTKREIIIDDAPPVLPRELSEQLVKARTPLPKELSFDRATSRRLAEYGQHVVTTTSGDTQPLVARYQTVAARLAMVHASLERASVVTLDHLDRALALVEYARRGLLWVFGMTSGNPLADGILRMLQANGPVTATYLTRHVERTFLKRQAAIDTLTDLGWASVVNVSTGGRPRTELHLNPKYRPFFPFSHVSAYPQGDATTADLEISPHLSVDGLEITWKKGGNKSERTGKNWLKGDESDPLVSAGDHATGEVMDTTGEWAKPCRDYPNHQTSHHKTPGGWVCVACWPEEEEG